MNDVVRITSSAVVHWLVVLLLVAMTLACARSPIAPSCSEIGAKDTSPIVMRSVRRVLGTFPDNPSYDIVLHANGLVEWEGKEEWMQSGGEKGKYLRIW